MATEQPAGATTGDNGSGVALVWIGAGLVLASWIVFEIIIASISSPTWGWCWQLLWWSCPVWRRVPSAQSLRWHHSPKWWDMHRRFPGWLNYSMT